MEKNDRERESFRYLKYMGAPFVLVVAPVLGFYFGSWLDQYFCTAPYLSYFFLFIGFASGIREFYRMIKAFEKNDF